MSEAVIPAGGSAGDCPERAEQATYEYAGFWVRAAAFVLDVIILNVIVFVIAFVLAFALAFFAMAAGWSKDMLTGAANMLGLLCGYGTAVAYHVVFTAGGWQATPGKRACGIYVMREDGSPVTAARAVGRYCAYFISFFTFCVGYMMAGWTDQKKALHDVICETRVVHGRR